jgi:hypothetical protein
MLQIHRRDSFAPKPQEGREIKVADGREVKVKAVGTLPLVLHGSFTFILNNVLFVPSL